MDMDRFDWLGLRTEAAIDTEQRIVDPHHHLWDRGGSTYLAAELLSDISGSHNVSSTVFVECKAEWNREVDKHMAPVGETGFVADQADELDAAVGSTIAGIVSHADMLLGAAVEEVLAAHDEAGRGRFRGIRHATAWHGDDDIHNAHTRSTEAMMGTPEFVAGVTKLGEMGFSFDAWLYHPQVDELNNLAAAVPGTQFVLDHLGGPLGTGRYALDRDAMRADWQASMRSIAARDNVSLKVGGIGMDNSYGMQWTTLPKPPSSEEVAAFWSDDVRWCIDLFGPSRCMFESNFPVDRQSLPYAVLWNALQIMAAGYSPDEKHDLFAGTAERVYRLP